MNNAPETTSQPFTSSSRAKSRSKLLQVLEHRPEQPFGQRSVATLIGMGKVVATRSSGSAQGRKRAAVQSQRVTDVVQADGVSQLRKEHADHVTPCTEGTCHGIHTRLARKFRNQMRRNEIAKLSKNAEFGCGWFGVSFFHLCRVTELKNHSNHFFLCFNQDSYGMAVFSNCCMEWILPRNVNGAWMRRSFYMPSTSSTPRPLPRAFVQPPCRTFTPASLEQSVRCAGRCMAERTKPQWNLFRNSRRQKRRAKESEQFWRGRKKSWASATPFIVHA